MNQKMYQDALTVQYAVNLSGVVRSWAEIMTLIWQEADAVKGGTDYVNRHPVNVLFASKVASLTGCEYNQNYHDAYLKCQEIAGTKNE